MIKARAGKLVVLGLSHRNLDLMRAGRPMDFSLDALGLDMKFFIFASETEATARAEMQELIGPDTVIIESPSKPPQG